MIFGELVQLIQDLQCFLSPTCKPMCVTELRYKEGAALGKSDGFLDFNNFLPVIPPFVRKSARAKGARVRG